MRAVVVLVLAGCGGHLGPDGSNHMQYGLYATIETGVSFGTDSGSGAGSGSAAPPAQSFTALPAEVAIDGVVGFSRFALRPNVAAHWDLVDHPLYIAYGVDLELKLSDSTIGWVGYAPMLHGGSRFTAGILYFSDGFYSKSMSSCYVTTEQRGTLIYTQRHCPTDDSGHIETAHTVSSRSHVALFLQLEHGGFDLGENENNAMRRYETTSIMVGYTGADIF